MSYNSPFTGNVIQPTDVSYRRITLTTDLQLEWPINGTTDDAAAARIMEASGADPQASTGRTDLGLGAEQALPGPAEASVASVQ
jgi:hypothetical protein